MDLLKNLYKNYHKRRFLFSFVNMSDVYIAWYLLNLDYKQSLFFLGPSSKTPETGKWPRAWLKAAAAHVSRVSRLRRSTLARACTPLTKSEERDCSQSRLNLERQYWTESNAPRKCVRFFCALFLSNEAVFSFAYVNHKENRTPVNDQIHF